MSLHTFIPRRSLRHNHSHSQRGFTLVELLVVIAIIGILIALLLPAIQAARATARRTQCNNSMRQVAIGMINHHDARKRFPIGTYNYIDSTFVAAAEFKGIGDRRCWMHDTLPFIEETALYKEFEKHMQTKPALGALGFPKSLTIIPSLMCAADPASPKDVTHITNADSAGVTKSQGFSGNIVACSGSKFFNEDSGPGPGGLNGGHYGSTRCDGVMFAASRTSARNITDGLSKTTILSEIILSPDAGDTDIRGRYYNPAHGGVHFTTLHTPNTPVPDRLNWCRLPEAAQQSPCEQNTNSMFLVARSLHGTGVNMSFADGSCHYITNDIDPLAYRALGSRNKGETTVSPTN